MNRYLHYVSITLALTVILLAACNGVSAPEPVLQETAVGCDVYVATNDARSSDSNDGQSLATALKTINEGISRLQPSQSLCIREGIYNEYLYEPPIPSGEKGDPTIIKAYRNDHVILKPEPGRDEVIRLSGLSAENQKHITFLGLVIDASNATKNGIKITSNFRLGTFASHITIQNSTVRFAKRQGILVTLESDNNRFLNLVIHNNGRTKFDHGFYISTSRNLVKDCDVFNNAGHGVQFYNMAYNDSEDDGEDSGPIVNDNVVRNNRVYNNGFDGILLSSGKGNIAYNNLVYGNKRNGIHAYLGATNTRIYHNTIYNNTKYGIRVNRRVYNTEILNNISIRGDGLGSRNNLGIGTIIPSAFNLYGYAGLVDPRKGDFRLHAHSRAIDKGMDLSRVKEDFVKTPRPQGGKWDIGAYEYR